MLSIDLYDPRIDDVLFKTDEHVCVEEREGIAFWR